MKKCEQLYNFYSPPSSALPPGSLYKFANYHVDVEYFVDKNLLRAKALQLHTIISNQKVLMTKLKDDKEIEFVKNQRNTFEILRVISFLLHSCK